MFGRAGALAVLFCLVATAASAQVIVQNYTSREYELSGGTNDIPQDAGPLLSGGTLAPTFWIASDVDYYHIQVTAVPSTLTVRLDGIDSLFGACDPYGWLENSSGAILVENDDIAYPSNLDSYFSYVFTTPGDYYVGARVSPFGVWNVLFTNYTPSGTYTYPDIDADPPDFGAGVGGAIRAIRQSSDNNQSAIVVWNPATDNQTPPNQIKYNVYHANAPADVFLGAPATTFVGQTMGLVTGLSSDSQVDYWFGVRAEDNAGNEDTNDHVVLAEVMLAVRRGRWMLYK